MKLVCNYIDKDKDQDKIGKMASEFANNLMRHGVPILETSNNGLNITTPHVYITFVSDLNKIVGRRFDVIFGAVPDNIRITHLKRPEYMFTGSLLDYVLFVEGL